MADRKVKGWKDHELKIRSKVKQRTQNQEGMRGERLWWTQREIRKNPRKKEPVDTSKQALEGRVLELSGMGIF